MIDAIYLLCCTPKSLPQGIDGKLPCMMHLEDLLALGLLWNFLCQCNKVAKELWEKTMMKCLPFNHISYLNQKNIATNSIGSQILVHKLIMTHKRPNFEETPPSFLYILCS